MFTRVGLVAKRRVRSTLDELLLDVHAQFGQRGDAELADFAASGRLELGPLDDRQEVGELVRQDLDVLRTLETLADRLRIFEPYAQCSIRCRLPAVLAAEQESPFGNARQATRRRENFRGETIGA